MAHLVFVRALATRAVFAEVAHLQLRRLQIVRQRVAPLRQHPFGHRDLAHFASTLQEERAADDGLRAIVGDQSVAVRGHVVHLRLQGARALHLHHRVEAAQLAEALAGGQHGGHRIGGGCRRRRGRHRSCGRFTASAATEQQGGGGQGKGGQQAHDGRQQAVGAPR
ncbi:hypothetical protein D3C71_1421530 [compost metagenome]